MILMFALMFLSSMYFYYGSLIFYTLSLFFFIVSIFTTAYVLIYRPNGRPVYFFLIPLTFNMLLPSILGLLLSIREDLFWLPLSSFAMSLRSFAL